MQKYLTDTELDQRMKQNIFVYEIWEGLTAEQKEGWLVTACNNIDSLSYLGVPCSHEAAFPRVFPDYSSDYLKSFNKITPPQVKQAVVEFIQHNLSYLSDQLRDLKDFKSAGLKVLKAGSVELEFAEFGIQKIPESIHRILSPFLNNGCWGVASR
jgi:hypothetical protein